MVSPSQLKELILRDRVRQWRPGQSPSIGPGMERSNPPARSGAPRPRNFRGELLRATGRAVAMVARLTTRCSSPILSYGSPRRQAEYFSGPDTGPAKFPPFGQRDLFHGSAVRRGDFRGNGYDREPCQPNATGMMNTGVFSVSPCGQRNGSRASHLSGSAPFHRQSTEGRMAKHRQELSALPLSASMRAVIVAPWRI